MQNTDKAGRPPGSATIMVVDDTPTNLELLEQMLNQRQHQVVCFTEGRLALAAAMRQKPDIILLDINMPEMNGFQVCEALKGNPNLAAIPIIFITAVSETIDKMKAFGLGAVDYVTKPFQVEEVIARVETHIRLQNLQRELQEKYDQLSELEKWRDALVHMIIHDLRSPLTAILGFADLLRLEVAQAGLKLEDRFQVMQRTIIGLTDMVSDILDVSKMSERKLNIIISESPVKDLVSKALDRVHISRQNKPVELHIPDNLVINCDRNLVERVLTNLLDNAIKHGPIYSPIKLTVTAQNSHTHFQIHDNGEIPEEFIPKLFERFEQAINRFKPSRRATGLGLAFCKLAIEAQNGTIGVTSEPGLGTQFWFTIPNNIPLTPPPPPPQPA